MEDKMTRREKGLAIKRGDHYLAQALSDEMGDLRHLDYEKIGKMVSLLNETYPLFRWRYLEWKNTNRIIPEKLGPSYFSYGRVFTGEQDKKQGRRP